MDFYLAFGVVLGCLFMLAVVLYAMRREAAPARRTRIVGSVAIRPEPSGSAVNVQPGGLRPEWLYPKPRRMDVPRTRNAR